MAISIPAVARRSAEPQSTRPLLIYVNIPFCNSKCHFCDWVVQVPVADLRLSSESPGRSGHLDALQAQIRAMAPKLLTDNYRAAIMYWGGGTASILTTEEIEALHDCLVDEFDLDGLREATIEGSPESLDAGKLALLRDVGFNRISIGVQSFEGERLRKIGRAHSADQAVDSVLAASAAGFDNINIDLIVGFPGQTLEEVEESLRTAVSLPVNHFSVYPYRATPGTVLRKQINRGDNDLDLRHQLAGYRLAQEFLEAHGFPEYAMSYFGAPRCQSDEAYYQLQMDWIGFGSGANSLINQRFLSNARGALHRFNSQPTQFDSDVAATSAALTLHFLSQALTTAEGMNAEVFRERTGSSLWSACEDPQVSWYLELMSEHGRLIADDDGIRLLRQDISQVYVALNWIATPTDGQGPAPAG